MVMVNVKFFRNATADETAPFLRGDHDLVLVHRDADATLQRDGSRTATVSCAVAAAVLVALLRVLLPPRRDTGEDLLAVAAVVLASLLAKLINVFRAVPRSFHPLTFAILLVPLTMIRAPVSRRTLAHAA
jgi:hypothetical protein